MFVRCIAQEVPGEKEADLVTEAPPANMAHLGLRDHKDLRVLLEIRDLQDLKAMKVLRDPRVVVVNPLQRLLLCRLLFP